MSPDDPTTPGQPLPRGRTHRRSRTRRRIVAGPVAGLVAGTGAGTPSPAPTPTAAAPAAATPTACASGAVGTRAQASAAGVPVGPPAQSDTVGGLASTGLSNAATYSALGGLLGVTAGCALVLRRRRGRASHAR
ncbi:LPXTG cell wall anchor domain-containing protein [Streptomyces turgidiscabies]|uniref:LPXTG-motif cell wall-anchored protein n=1 Tax=Streptomyces turgidiscabies TaxID=85558 RepID=A0ABU0RPG5_9ACTN|nr:LPXTG cell wall anchor domain-containing protein [Streptomyces turgidiscabies]MDQ0933878.1 LPXTG-motif cell wall-anchored protein [Streptomyces turgidiscabies]